MDIAILLIVFFVLLFVGVPIAYALCISAAVYLVGFDFPQDYDIRRLRTEDEHNLTLTTHDYLLKKDILMIEYMTNLWSVESKVVDFVGLPTALENVDGAQIRCIAIEDVE